MTQADLNEQLQQHGAGLLPAWFTERMMTDQWRFGLLLITGQVMEINSIDNIVRDAAGNLWVDCEMSDAPTHGNGDFDSVFSGRFITSPTSRSKVSINACHIVAAFELADT